jgi:hypothetical protein
MKQKKSSDANMKAAAERLGGKAQPYIKPWLILLKAFFQRHALATLTFMFALVIVNIILLFVFTGYTSKGNFDYASLKKLATDSAGGVSDMGVPFSWENYHKMKAIQDTLSWLASKKHRTAEDSLLLHRTFEKIRSLDPSFYNKVMALKGDSSLTKKK